MKKLIYLAITFFTFIFSFIAPIKNNFNININNNKIVEKLDPKRAFENAPEKETSLPGFNKEFKVYINLTTTEECLNLLSYLEENRTEEQESIMLLFAGESFTTIDNEQVRFTFVIFYSQDYLWFNAGEQNFSFNTDSSGNLFSGGSYFTNEQIVATFSNFNQLLSEYYFNSFDTWTENTNEPINVSDVLKNQSYIYGYDVVSNSAVPGLIGTISSIATGLLSLLISLFSSVVAIFWNVSNNTPTFLGVVTLFIVAVPITYWVINFVIGLIKKIRLTRGK